MSKEVKRFYIMPGSVSVLLSGDPAYTPMTNHVTDVHTVPLVLASNYDALLAELDSLKLALNMIDAADWQCGADATDNQISMAKGSLIRQMKRIASAALQGEQL